jgi:cytochrome c6
MALDAPGSVTQDRGASDAEIHSENVMKVLSFLFVALMLFASTPALAADAAALYAKSCASCHGPDGKAATPAAAAMKVPAIAGHDAAASVSAVKGSDKHKAPAAKLSDEDLEAIAIYIAGL